MFYSSKAFLLLVQLLLNLSTLTQANGNDHDDNDASCSPAEVDPSPIQHFYAEDGMEVNLITFNALGQDAQYSPNASYSPDYLDSPDAP